MSAHPNCSFTILNQLANSLPVQLRIVSQRPVFPARKPFVGANPKSPVASAEQGSNRSARQMLSGRRLPRHTPNAIKTN
jgi:hypothetical protein